MTDGEAWSPVCQKCGGFGNAEVRPPPTMVFAGRLRPDAMKPYTFGTRVRCRRCNAWFTIGPGTEWRPVSQGKVRAGAGPPKASGVAVEEPFDLDEETGDGSGEAALEEHD